MNRRAFIGMSASAAASLALSPSLFGQAAAGASGQPSIPRWRGFNLTELTGGKRGQHYRESDFEWMAGWGFNFARLPCSYWAWADRKDWKTIDEKALQPIDEAIEFGRQHGIHINLNRKHYQKMNGI